MTLQKLFKMCANCTIRRIFKVTISGSTELLSALDALEQYGDNEVIASPSVVAL